MMRSAPSIPDSRRIAPMPSLPCRAVTHPQEVKSFLSGRRSHETRFHRQRDSVYETATKCEITRHWVDHAALAEISRTLRSLVQLLDSEAEEEFWQRALGPVRRLAFAFCATPLPFDRAAAA